MMTSLDHSGSYLNATSARMLIIVQPTIAISSIRIITISG